VVVVVVRLWRCGGVRLAGGEKNVVFVFLVVVICLCFVLLNSFFIFVFLFPGKAPPPPTSTLTAQPHPCQYLTGPPRTLFVLKHHRKTVKVMAQGVLGYRATLVKSKHMKLTELPTCKVMQAHQSGGRSDTVRPRHDTGTR